MIYIQGKDGLTQVSPSLTKEKIIAALGYIPADNATFYEDDSGALIVTDEKGYVIARIDGEGLTTTKVSASAIKLNDVDLASKLAELEAATPNVDLSNYYTKSEVDDAIANIDNEGADLSQYALATDVAAHVNNNNIHITNEDRNKWNEKSNFSGDYKDLSNAPNISIENDEELVISDASGNIIMKVDANGLNTTNLYLNNQLKLASPLMGKKLSILGASISTYQDYIPAGYQTHYPSGDVKNVDLTWWKQLINNTGMILGGNASYGGSSIQTDGSGISYLNDGRIAHLGINGDPDIIIIQAGINDGKVEDLSALGEINREVNLPITADSISTYDTTTFLGAYQALITKLMVTYPNAQIACWSLTWTSRPGIITSDDIAVASDKIKELCEFYGLTYLDIRKCGINPVNMTTYLGAGDDTITHPNAAGMELIAKYIEKQLQ